MPILAIVVVVLVVLLGYFQYQTAKNYRVSVGERTLILFSSDSCGHCRDFQPTWDKLVVSGLPVSFAQMKDPEPSWNVDAVPTIRMYYGKPTPADKNFVPFLGPRTEEAITAFVRQ